MCLNVGKFQRSFWFHGCQILSFEQVDICPGKIYQSACVISVQVGLDNIPDILHIVSQSFYLICCCFAGIAGHTHIMQEKAGFQGGGRIILGSESGIYQYQAAAGLSQQTVDD